MAESDAPKDQAPVNQLVTSEQRQHLEGLFSHIVSNATVDYTNKEIQNIKTAVYTMCEKIRTRVNTRSVFNIARVIPTGSMAEETSLWKRIFDVFPYLEFDFLAQLKNQTTQNNYEGCIKCNGCIKIVNPPMESTRIRQYYNRENREDSFYEETLDERQLISDMFVKEINYCLTSSCDCLSFQCEEAELGEYTILLFPSSVEHKHGCGECTVDMPTGTLHVNTEIPIDQNTPGPNKCSLIFLWTSKTNSLSVSDRFLIQEHHHVSLLRIFVDFLPALESLKPTSSGALDEHDYFIVPKRCNSYACRDGGSWRKSLCMAELNAFTTEMSVKHRWCYQIIKYLLEARWSVSVPSYHIKTVVLCHHATCSDNSDDRVSCVIAIYRDLLHAAETEELLSYRSNLNIIEMNELDRIFDRSKILFKRHEQILCSVSVADTWRNFILKIWQSLEN